MKLKFDNSFFLKAAIFATGLSGIVAEYVLATLATYFLGDQLVQWTMIISIMLFSMGLGSRLSRLISSHILEKFIITEMILSLVTAFSAMAVYSISAFSVYDGALIYLLSIVVGLLIGLEIPLVTRANEEYEKLRFNISSVMEKDYYGSLLGGMFFAFVGLPFLGLTYTPVLLGAINLLVAIILFLKLKNLISANYRKYLGGSLIAVFATIAIGGLQAEPIIQYGDQAKYLDKVVYSKQTQYQKITLTQWKNDHWLYINGNQQLSTLDEFLYHEPLVHPAASIHGAPEKALILGGGDGCAARELLKYSSLQKIDLVDLDPEMIRLGKEHPIFKQLNDSAFWNEKVHLHANDAKLFLEQSTDFYDLIIIDLPDPKTVELSMLYTREFYRLCYQHLTKHGVLVTQAGSPYYATKAFYCIEKTFRAAGFNTLPIHNQVLTMGQWGWIIGHKELSQKQLRQRLLAQDFENLPLNWLNHEALKHISHFGAPLADTSGLEVNSNHNPVLYRYYLNGNWDLY